MTKVIKQQIDKIEQNESKLFWSFLSCFIISVMVYGYSVNTAIWNVVKRQSIEKEVATVQADLGNIEAAYMAEKSKITLDYALGKGYVATIHPHFVSAAPLVETLSLVGR